MVLGLTSSLAVFVSPCHFVGGAGRETVRDLYLRGGNGGLEVGMWGDIVLCCAWIYGDVKH